MVIFSDEDCIHKCAKHLWDNNFLDCQELSIDDLKPAVKAWLEEHLTNICDDFTDYVNTDWKRLDSAIYKLLEEKERQAKEVK